MKKQFLSVLIIITIINFIVPFSIVFVNKNNLIQKNITQAADCTIISAEFNPKGEQPYNFFKENYTKGDVVIKTKDCVNKQGLTISIYESDGATGATDDAWNDSGLFNLPITVPTDNFAVRMTLGEEDCETLVGGGLNFDCDLFFKIRYNDNVIYNSYWEEGGELFYECDLLCNIDAKFLQIVPLGSNDKPVDVDPLEDTTKNNNIYTLLAPIGKLVTAPENIGDYFNIIFKIAIGLCAALAVIMIVIGGVQYMGDESIFGKTEAKSRITSAILGLLIALGAYAILNTINPDLLGKGGVQIDQVSAEIDEETTPWSTYETGDNTASCPSGFKNVIVEEAIPNKINVCGTIAQDLANIISAAKKDGITLSGYGSRSKASQVQKRIQNCGGSANIYNKDAVCKPKTAIPGNSNHEKGLAVDFNCNGKTMTESGGINSVCYKWLTVNGGVFKNNYSATKESWHWSAGENAGR